MRLHSTSCPWGGLGWVYPWLCSTPRLRLNACKLRMGMVSNEDLNDEPFFGLIPVIVAVLPLNCPPQLRPAIQCSILRIQDKRRL